MMNEYFEFLVDSYNEATDEFESLKANIVKEVSNMSAFTAEEYGAAYSSNIERMTAVAGKIRSLSESIRMYVRLNDDTVAYEYDENHTHIIIK